MDLEGFKGCDGFYSGLEMKVLVVDGSEWNTRIQRVDDGDSGF